MEGLNWLGDSTRVMMGVSGDEGEGEEKRRRCPPEEGMGEGKEQLRTMTVYIRPKPQSGRSLEEWEEWMGEEEKVVCHSQRKKGLPNMWRGLEERPMMEKEEEEER